MPRDSASIKECKDVICVLCRNDVVAFQGGLSDYLIKVVPSFIKFAVAGPGQSTDIYQEPTIYTTPDHIVPLCRCVWFGAAMRYRPSVSSTGQPQVCWTVVWVVYQHQQCRYSLLLCGRYNYTIWCNKKGLAVLYTDISGVPLLASACMQLLPECCIR